MRIHFAAALILGAAVVLAASHEASAQAKKEPPACALIKFRALPEGTGEGEQEAGMYKSRFGRVNVMGTVKNGRAENYFVTVDGKKLGPAGTLPASVTSCAQTKKMPAPAAAAPSACTGSRLNVLIDRSGDKRVLALYALEGKKWVSCGAGTA
jgi:hypothetical protein